MKSRINVPSFSIHEGISQHMYAPSLAVLGIKTRKKKTKKLNLTRPP